MSEHDLDEQELIEVFNEFAVKYGKNAAKQLAIELAQGSEYFAEVEE